jgi:hypothetical protein
MVIFLKNSARETVAFGTNAKIYLFTTHQYIVGIKW